MKMSARREEQMQRLTSFLSILDKVKESGVVFSSTILKRDVLKMIKEFYASRSIATIDEACGIKEEIDRIVRASLQEGHPLLVTISAQSAPLILTRLEKLLAEGCLDVPGTDGHVKESPAKGWYAVVWVDSSSYQDREFPLKDLFGYKLGL